MSGLINSKSKPSGENDFYVEPLGEYPGFATVRFPDGTLALDSIMSTKTAKTVCAAFNNFVVMRDNMDSNPRWICEMFLREVAELKPKLESL